MSTILTIPPALEPVSLIEAKEHLKIDNSTDDGLINQLITTARQQVEKQTGKVMIDQTWLIYLSAWPSGSQVELPIAPITAINNLRTYSDDDVASTIDPSHYFADLASSPQKLVRRASRIWPKPGRVANGIEIEVTAGFGSVGSKVPSPLRTAMLLLIAHWYENRQFDCPAGANGYIATELQNLLGAYKRVKL